MKTCLVALVLAAFAAGCAPRHAATTWGYSHWYERVGVGMTEAFEEQQKRCLEQIGATGDPSSIAPDSREEDDFIARMNGSGWCTTAYQCNKPGA